jgi:hypothetical protein
LQISPRDWARRTLRGINEQVVNTLTAAKAPVKRNR